jgi:hypothetical protein
LNLEEKRCISRKIETIRNGIKRMGARNKEGLEEDGSGGYKKDGGIILLE